MKNTYFKLSAVLLLAALLLGGARLGAQSLILTSDEQLNDLMDPDKKLDLSLGYTPYHASLRDICEQGKKQGSKQMVFAFDEFFRQYRQHAGTERRLTPDMDEYVEKIKFVSDFAKKYDIGLCLSLLSPLELGTAYKNQTGHSGRWLAYKVGLRDGSTGKFSVPIWEQLYWTNNKGKTPVKLKGVKAYAFKEKPVGNSPFRAVNPDEIVELKEVKYEAMDTYDSDNFVPGVGNTGNLMRLLRVYGEGGGLEGYDRVMVLLEYETQEMDYFNEDALPFLKALMKKYHDNDINLTALYSDEMHIQQDWFYFSHHENGQFAERYLTESMADKYRKKFGQPFDDKYMLYFAYGAPNYQPTVEAVVNVQYVMGDTPEDIHRTFLLRDRYYRMLNDEVVDLFKAAKDYAEELFGRELETSAHASWAQSPTIDYWNYEKRNGSANQYEYTSNFIWGNTVHQAAAACYDYFKWSEYLEPTGNDFAEGGWADRDYYGAAMAASIAVVNEYPVAYAAAWGMPAEVYDWKMSVNDAFGTKAGKPMDMLTGHVTRDVDVLILYPMNLVAAEERFGSWMAQYGYANYLTADKLLAMGEVTADGKIKVGDKTYGTLVAMFEVLPEKGLLDMMGRLAKAGGKVVWFSAPPLIDKAGGNCAAAWSELFGAKYEHDIYMGEMAPGRVVSFCNDFAAIPQQTVLTDFLVDRIYPVEADGAQVVAKCGNQVLGTLKKLPGGGALCYVGMRPRDDQSQSLGYETRTLFEVLNAVGACPATGKFAGVNDNPSYVSRTTDYFATSFPNGATAVVKHYRTHPESWPGGFSRNREEDVKALEANPLPCDRMELRGLKVNGHEVTYDGKISMAFRTGADGKLVSFFGRECDGVTIDGVRYSFSEQPVSRIVFAPSLADEKVTEVLVEGQGRVTLPLAGGKKKPVVKLGKKTIKTEVADGQLVLNVDPSISGRWLTVHR